MKTRYSLLTLTFAFLLAGCASGGAMPVDPMVPPGGISYPDEAHEPRLTNLRRLTNAGQNAEAYFSADGQELIFQATLPGITQCDQQFTMTLDGQNLEMVSTGDGRTTCGYFYAGDERIVYASTHEASAVCPAPPDYSMGYVWALSDYDIYTSTDDGGDLTKIFGSDVYDAEPTLSPDEETIVFTSAESGDLEIYTMNTDGSNVQRLTHEIGYDGGPFFSPDGSKIVYRASHPTDPAAVADYQRLLAQGLIRPRQLDIWVMDTDGSNKTQITDNGAANFGPFFHPSGEKIVFSSNMHDPTGRDFDLYLINVDGTGLERVTIDPDFDGFPMWSPADPGTFVFASNRGGNVEGETNVYLADWVDDPAPLTLSAPIFPTDEPMPAEAQAAHAAAGVQVAPAVDSVACPAFDPDDLADLADFTGRYLADDALEGREAGTRGGACAAQFVAFAMQRLGLAPGGEDDSYFQEASLASVMNPHAPGGTGRNVLGILPGTDRALAGEYVVIGAHFDHLGMGGMNSLAAGEPAAIHNGADDNASGVAAMLAVAEELAIGPRPERTVIFMAFTGEESGLLGSNYWVNNPTVDLENVVAMINMDMVGRLGENGLVVYGTGTAGEWESILEPALAAAGITDVGFNPEGYGNSDQTSFYVVDIPVLHLFTNTHSQYHRPEDDWTLIDVAGIRTIAGVVADVARDVGGMPRMEVIAGVGAPEPSEGDEAASPGYGAYLGTIPDFSPVEYGVLLGGVREGAPADMAGMQKGDILVKIGDHEVADLYAMTDALRSYRPGEVVVLEWLRDGERMSAETTLTSRN